MSQFNNLPKYDIPLIIKGVTSKDWYLFFTGVFRGLPPANVSPVTLTGSPFTYTATNKCVVLLSGGTVSLVEFSRDGTTFYNTGETAGQFTLCAADLLRVTYTVAPTMTAVPT